MRFLDKVLSPEITVFLGEKIFTALNCRNSKTNLQLKEIEKVLVVRPDEIGDMILSSPFFRELRNNLPSAWITVVVHPKTYNILEFCPYVNEVLTFNCDLTTGSGHAGNLLRALWLASKCLIKRRFDLAIFPRMDVDLYYGSYVTYLSGAHFRVGYSENASPKKIKYNRGYNIFFTHILENNKLQHDLEYTLDTITSIGGTVTKKDLELWLSSEDMNYADLALREYEKGPSRLLVGFGPGSRQRKRMWPVSRFIEVGRWLVSEFNSYILVLGGKEEEFLGKEICEKIGHNVIDMVGKSTLRQSAALLRKCDLFIGNDTATMHLAAAAGVPVIEISCHPQSGSPSHPNSPLRFRPWGEAHKVLQPENPIPPCSNACYSDDAHCIKGVETEKVREAVINYLRETPAFSYIIV